MIAFSYLREEDGAWRGEQALMFAGGGRLSHRGR